MKKTVKKVTNIRNISIEKVKQKRTIKPKGQRFEAIRELKDYISENDKHLTYNDDDDDELFLWYGWPTKGV